MQAFVSIAFNESPHRMFPSIVPLSIVCNTIRMATKQHQRQVPRGSGESTLFEIKTALLRIVTCIGCVTVCAFAIDCVGGKNHLLQSQQTPTSATPQSTLASRTMLLIPAGNYYIGSTQEDRERGYKEYRNTSGQDSARDNLWFAKEQPLRHTKVPSFRIDKTPVTNAAYAEYLQQKNIASPCITKSDWEKQGFQQHYENAVLRFCWNDKKPPEKRRHHPVVLVTWQQAHDYCHWRGNLSDHKLGLPTALQYAVAARGATQWRYPWGDEFLPDNLNSQVHGPYDTMAVESLPEGNSPTGMTDAAGNVFQWTQTPWPYKTNAMTVKGSSWDDFGGLGRVAAQHGRNKTARHVIVGFRCATQ